MIEPTMTVIVGVVLGWVVLAVLGPVYDAVASIRL
jgi:type IV pilus assembly protein PilC